MNVFIGIDIGLDGALAVVDGSGRAEIRDIPTLNLPDAGKRLVKRRIDGRELIHLIRAMVPAGHTAIAVIEDVHAGIGPGAAARTSVAQSRGAIEAVLDVARIDMRVVQPSTWKRSMGLIGKDKDEARQCALRLYPRASEDLRLKKHHNRSDALLIAHWAQRQFA